MNNNNNQNIKKIKCQLNNKDKKINKCQLNNKDKKKNIYSKIEQNNKKRKRWNNGKKNMNKNYSYNKSIQDGTMIMILIY